MIRVHKRDRAPKILRGRGANQTEEDKRTYDESPADYRTGARTFDVVRDIYGAKSVKNALKKDQHSKCAFCEAKVDHVAYGDVEHFRPKKGFRQIDTDDLGRPGYYWLAYAWGNLFFACQICNQRHKRNLFPLTDAGDRARSNHDAIAEEKPLFLDPVADDPSDHVGFREEYAYPIDDDPRAVATIDGLGLNREELAGHRRDWLAMLEALKDVIVLDLPETEKARAVLRAAGNESAQYASMARGSGFGQTDLFSWPRGAQS